MNKVKTSRTIWLWLIVFTFFFLANAAAQKQANHWFALNFTLDFNHKPVKISPSPIPNTITAEFSSISDHEGNLLFCTNSEYVYDKNYNVMPNGETGIYFSKNENSLVIPKPGSTQFYILTGHHNDYSLAYTMVDMSLNNGLGDVSQKAKLLPTKTYEKIAATGNCENFWMLTTQPLQMDRYIEHHLFRYAIDIEGLHEKPDTLTIGNYFNFYWLKFSPSGSRLIFLTATRKKEPWGFQTVLCDFNLETGEVSNPVSFFYGNNVTSYEFSPDETKLYASVDNFLVNEFDLYQLDISSNDSLEIEYSKTMLYKGNRGYRIGKLYLTPHGTILGDQLSEIGKSKSAMIEFPNEKGMACSFKTDALNFYLFNEGPYFVSTFLGPNFNAGFIVDAGENRATCSGISVPLGQESNYGIQYQWEPGNYLSATAQANPAFLYPDTISVETDFTFILEGKKGYCQGADTVTITVHPDKHTPIFGSRSVCPGVTEVDYRAAADERFSYHWSFDGGEIIPTGRTDSIKVNWGVTNPNANVTLVPYNKLDCPSNPIIFPVRINVELQTETPVGDELLCSNLATEIPYAITNTNGSVYTWESDYGTIVAGQGANEITINWPGDGKYTLWVKEQSATIDTVCYGVSDSLLVNLFTDSTRLEIDFASVLEEDASNYELQWYVSDTSRISKEIEIYSSLTSSNWELIHSSSKSENAYQFRDSTMNYAPLSFKVASVNGCKEHLESEVHTVMHLEGIADSSLNTMRINWTPYIGWANNIEQYEIWYKRDEENGYGLVASFKPDQLQWSNNWGANAFEHHYRIRAIHSSYPFESWSNELKLEFKHEIEIPNVFTPNRDGINETFSFLNLELFHENELIIVDRNGIEVFAKSNYRGDWNGRHLPSGVYYYSFHAQRNNRLYKGWLQILR